MLTNVQIIQSSKNYNVIQVENDIICFSYKKPISIYNGENKKLVKINKNITTETNKKHFAYFLKYLKKVLTSWNKCDIFKLQNKLSFWRK